MRIFTKRAERYAALGPVSEEYYVTELGVGTVLRAPATCRSSSSCPTRDAVGAAELPRRAAGRWRSSGTSPASASTFDLDVDAYAAVHGLTRLRARGLSRRSPRCPTATALSYRDLATAAGHPNAYRAVGSAMARNELPVILPCHRVVKNDGRLGFYGDDPAWKARLLRLEGVAVDGDRLAAAGRTPAADRPRGRRRERVARGPAVRDHHRPLRRRQVAGDGLVRGRRLVLRRQPAAASSCRRWSTCSAARAARSTASPSSATCAAASTSAVSSSCSTSCTSAASSTRSCSWRRPTRRSCGASRRRAAATRWPAGGTVVDGIRKERRLLAGLRERATLVVDTSDTSIHQLKARLNEDLIQHTRRTNIVFAVVSFGYKYGIPIDADLLFDVRFLPNPHYDLRLRPLTGLDAEVRDFVLQSPGTRRVPRAPVPAARLPLPALRRRGQGAPHHRRRLHRRAPPLGGHRADASASATRSRATTRSSATET